MKGLLLYKLITIRDQFLSVWLFFKVWRAYFHISLAAFHLLWAPPPHHHYPHPRPHLFLFLSTGWQMGYDEWECWPQIFSPVNHKRRRGGGGGGWADYCSTHSSPAVLDFELSFNIRKYPFCISPNKGLHCFRAALSLSFFLPRQSSTLSLQQYFTVHGAERKRVKVCSVKLLKLPHQAVYTLNCFLQGKQRLPKTISRALEWVYHAPDTSCR